MVTPMDKTDGGEAQDVVARLENVRCDRPPFTPEHADCICRLTNAGAREITSLREENERLREALTAVKYLMARTTISDLSNEDAAHFRAIRWQVEAALSKGRPVLTGGTEE